MLAAGDETWPYLNSAIRLTPDCGKLPQRAQGRTCLPGPGRDAAFSGGSPIRRSRA